MLNNVTLMGRLTRDPELRYTQSNLPVTSFSIAVERNTTGTDGKREVDFIDIVAWRKTAEIVCQYFRKGSLIAVEGSIQTRPWTDKQGNNRTAVEVVASSVYFTGERKQEERKPSGRDVVFMDEFQDVEDDDGELPF